MCLFHGSEVYMGLQQFPGLKLDSRYFHYKREPCARPRPGEHVE